MAEIIVDDLGVVQWVNQYEGPGWHPDKEGIRSYHSKIKREILDFANTHFAESEEYYEHSMVFELAKVIWKRERSIRQDYEVQYVQALERIDELNKKVDFILDPIRERLNDLGVTDNRILHAMRNQADRLATSTRVEILAQEAKIQEARMAARKEEEEKSA